MNVTVEMTAEELEDFLEYRKDREKYRVKQMDAVKEQERLPLAMAIALGNAVEPVDGKPGKFKIVSQEHMSDAWDYAGRIAEEIRDGVDKA